MDDALSSRGQPNVVLVLADDLGYGDLGCYGSARNRTPNIDRLAETGTKLTNFYMSSPVCSPSRAALITGCYPQRVGLGRGETFDVLLPGDPIGLHPAESTLPRCFREGGYRTAMVGKWHLGDQPEFLPQRHGFEQFLGLPYSNDMHPPRMFPREEGYRFPRLPLLEGSVVIEEDPIQETLTDRYTTYALDFIATHPNDPFFLYFAHMYMHTPLKVPSRYRASSQNGDYGAALEHLDESVGRMVTALQQWGLADRTIVIFTSDNGSSESDGSNTPLRGGKAGIWEGGVRVPCIVNWPGHSRQGASDSLVTAMDLLPTLLSVCGLLPVTAIDGVDASGLLFGEEEATMVRDVFAYFNADRLEAIQWQKWKLHLMTGELYDLETDMGETRDVSGQEPAVVEHLEQLAEQLRSDLGDTVTGVEGAGVRPPGRVADPTTLTDFPPIT